MTYNKLFIPCFVLMLLLVTAFAGADGFIVMPEPIPVAAPFPLEVKYHHVNVDIDNLSAVTTIDQEFYNPTSYRLEGYYIFPKPENAVITKFSMQIQGKNVSAELLDAGKARSIYEDIVRKMKDPALLEYVGRDIYKVRIFPIEPYSTKRVTIAYRELLTRDSGSVMYIYPLNTEKFSAKPLNDVSIVVNINSDDNVHSVYSPTHEIDVVQKGPKNATAAFEEKSTKPDVDFKLYYSMGSEPFGISHYAYRESGDDGFFFMNLSPAYVTGNTYMPKDITFVLDTSGSMAGEKLAQAKKALLFCIHNLKPDDGFQIIRFSAEAEQVFPALQKANPDNIDKAKSFIKDMAAIGGTNIEEALGLALGGDEKMERDAGRPHMIVFITDGKPTIGQTDTEKLITVLKKVNPKTTRIFTFGIGDDINTHLLDRITQQTRAYRSYILPDQDIELEISSFYSKVSSPVLSDLEIRLEGGVTLSRVYPDLKNLPDLFKGSSLSLIGRYSGQGKVNFILEGNVGTKRKKMEYELDFPKSESEHDFIPPLWAARRVGFLLDAIRLNGEEKELIDEVVILSRKYGIITPYTSYLIVEDEERRTASSGLEKRYQTLGNINDLDDEFREKNAEEYRDMNSESGHGSVQASKEVQDLAMATNKTQTTQGSDRLFFKKKDGKIMNITQQIRNIQGRAVYNNGSFWIDSLVQEKNKAKVKRLQFASAEYFKLLKSTPLAKDFLSLGKNVLFTINGVIYEIYE
ncbi:MAG: VWA domain-containing protein [Spirochaetales bacterium]|nr:VWA domain-containing protein [Spirochaetales bacterium]